MRMPWSRQTGLAKAATIFSVLLLVSTGLCGANILLFSHFGAVSGGTTEPPRSAGLSMVIMSTGFAEMIGMLVGGCGLIAAIIAAAIRAIAQRISRKDDS